ncbi:MAG: hypothetical protein ACYCSJ_02265 [Acidimicrobiales bacterium]
MTADPARDLARRYIDQVALLEGWFKEIDRTGVYWRRSMPAES